MKRYIAVTAFLLAMAGCQTCQRSPAQTQGPVWSAPKPAPILGGPPAPFPIQQPSVSQAPPPGYPFNPQAVAPPPQQFPRVAPAPVPETRTEARWQSGPGQVQLAPPEPIAPEQNQTPGNLPKTTLPAGIPHFTNARDGVSAGLRPSLDDGLDWLKANGYKIVVHLRLPGEVNDADRKQVEKRGMQYLSLEVSPQNLRKQTLEEFVSLVRNSNLEPLFVYDRDGALAGPLWFWYFRNAEQQTEDAARQRAEALGLRETRAGLHQEMWQALRKIMDER